jgi:hypothetical protein
MLAVFTGLTSSLETSIGTLYFPTRELLLVVNRASRSLGAGTMVVIPTRLLLEKIDKNKTALFFLQLCLFTPLAV